MWPFSSKRRSRVAVLLHDGTAWHAQVFAFGRPHWRSVTSMAIGGHNPRVLPEPLLDFADKHGARRVRLVLPQNIHTLKMELPADAEAEELQTAMAFELGGETGAAVEALRVAAARAETFRMGAAPDMLLAASFDEAALEQYVAACRAAGLDFDGAGALELAALAVHAERQPKARLLLLRHDTTFYAVPATEVSPMTAGPVAFAAGEEAYAELDEERYERIIRRFNLHLMLPMSICCLPMPSENHKQQLRELAGGRADVEFRDLGAEFEHLARQVAETAEIGYPAGGGAVVGTRPPEKDPHRAGTWLFFLLLLTTIASLGLYWYLLRTDLEMLKIKAEAWEAIQGKRKLLEQQHDGLRVERSRCEQTVRLLESKSPLPKGLLPLLDALDRAIPEFTRVTSIDEDGQGGFLVRGHTAVQDRLSDLEKTLLAEMAKLGLLVEQRHLAPIEGSLECEFEYWVGPKKE
jgi:hypothetical protein